MTNTTSIDKRSSSYKKPHSLRVPTELLEELTTASTALLLHPTDLRSRSHAQSALEKMGDFLRASYAELNGIPAPILPTKAQLDALQALVDQAQELNMGYGPGVAPTDTPDAIAAAAGEVVLVNFGVDGPSPWTSAAPRRSAGEPHVGAESDGSERT